MPDANTATVDPSNISAADLTAASRSVTPASATVNTTNNDDESSAQLIDKGDYTLEFKEFAKDSAAGGFGYFTLQFKNVATAVAKYGEDKVLAVLNPAITGALRIKAKSNLPDLDDAEKNKEATAQLLASTKGILLTEQEAEEYIPGVRGKTSVNSLIAEAKAAHKEGRIEDSKRLYAQAFEAMQEQALKLYGAPLDEVTNSSNGAPGGEVK